ncbi:MAG: hypothetical protein V4691_05545 [Pseudomonadota bacterium]
MGLSIDRGDITGLVREANIPFYIRDLRGLADVLPRSSDPKKDKGNGDVSDDEAEAIIKYVQTSLNKFIDLPDAKVSITDENGNKKDLQLTKADMNKKIEQGEMADYYSSVAQKYIIWAAQYKRLEFPDGGPLPGIEKIANIYFQKAIDMKQVGLDNKLGTPVAIESLPSNIAGKLFA